MVLENTSLVALDNGSFFNLKDVDLLGNKTVLAGPERLFSSRWGSEKTLGSSLIILKARQSSVIVRSGLKFFKAVDLPELDRPVKI